MSNQTMTLKPLFLDEEIPSFSSWTDGKENYWIVADKKHVWKDNKPTNVITHLYLVNVKTENQNTMIIDTFNELLLAGKIRRTIKTV